MSDFPTILYRCPGPNPGNRYTYGTRPANNLQEFDAAVSDGWHPTLPGAVTAWQSPPAQVPPPIPDPEPVDDSAPTRAEIEAKARELGIRFDGRSANATLLRKIEEALNGLVQT